MSLSSKIQKKLRIHTPSKYEILPVHHVLFWLVYFLFNLARWGSYYNDYMLSLKGNLLGFPIHMALCYFTIYLLVPKFLKKRKILLFMGSLLLAIFFMVLLKYYLTFLLISTNVWPEGPEVTSSPTFNYLLNMMIGEFYVVSFVSAIKLTIDWMRESRRASKLEKTKLQTELRFLRAQISPHFLFNTLNNIYALTLDRSPKAPEIVLGLSEYMRYLLYETSEGKQELQKEIACIQNYLDLERIRYGDRLKLEMEVNGDIQNKHIASLLLIPFIENAFKHGANRTRGHIEILIKFRVEQNRLFFRISNTLPQELNGNRIKGPGGIGIANVRKRLELGYKPGEYELKNYEDEENYIVELNLKLR